MATVQIVFKHKKDKKLINTFFVSEYCCNVMYCHEHGYKSSCCNKKCNSLILVSKNLFINNSCYNVIRCLNKALMFMKMTNCDLKCLMNEMRHIVDVALLHQDCYFG